jgi:hypothetical protein
LQVGAVEATFKLRCKAGTAVVASTGATPFDQTNCGRRARRGWRRPGPYELLLMALGSCTSMTVNLYAARKKWPLDQVVVGLKHGRVALGLENGLPRPVGQRLVPPAMRLAPAGGWRQDGQKRQRPTPAGPADRHHQHQRQPSQATGLDEVPLGGPHRVAIDAACLDLRAPPALDRVVDADDDRPAGQQPVQQMQQEPPCQGASQQVLIALRWTIRSLTECYLGDARKWPQSS